MISLRIPSGLRFPINSFCQKIETVSTFESICNTTNASSLCPLRLSCGKLIFSGDVGSEVCGVRCGRAERSVRAREKRKKNDRTKRWQECGKKGRARRITVIEQCNQQPVTNYRHYSPHYIKEPVREKEGRGKSPGVRLRRNDGAKARLRPSSAARFLSRLRPIVSWRPFCPLPWHRSACKTFEHERLCARHDTDVKLLG